MLTDFKFMRYLKSFYVLLKIYFCYCLGILGETIFYKIDFDIFCVRIPKVIRIFAESQYSNFYSCTNLARLPKNWHFCVVLAPAVCCVLVLLFEHYRVIPVFSTAVKFCENSEKPQI